MAIPTFQALMRPLLVCLSDGDAKAVEDIRECVASALGLSPAERAEPLPSGKRKRFNNRVHWALVYLNAARAI